MFVEEWRSSKLATAFALILSLAILGMVVLMFAETQSFGITDVDACTAFVAGQVLTSLFALELCCGQSLPGRTATC
jgi:hypothetical protein